eukprot:14822833-Alexandrium_andersonii.AAC.1
MSSEGLCGPAWSPLLRARLPGELLPGGSGRCREADRTNTTLRCGLEGLHAPLKKSMQTNEVGENTTCVCLLIA